LTTQAPQAPARQTSPLPQLVPLPWLLQVVVEVAGAHTWQGFVGFCVPPA
jgi:hypothetical protein